MVDPKIQSIADVLIADTTRYDADVQAGSNNVVLDLFNEPSTKSELILAADFLKSDIEGHLYEGTLRNGPP